MKCLACGNDFKTYQSQLKVGKGKFCSKKCSNSIPRVIWNKGKTWSEDVRQRIRSKLKGRKLSLETRIKMSLSNRGKRPYVMTDEIRKKMSEVRRGRRLSDEARIKLSKAMSGKKSHLWRGGRTSETNKLRHGVDYKIWIRNVFKRDNYTCQDCGVRGKYIEAHHIVPFSVLREEKKIISDVDLYDLDNGMTLCKECHKKTSSYKQRLENLVEYRLINSIKSLFEQERPDTEFEAFYQSEMSRLIEEYQNKLI